MSSRRTEWDFYKELPPRPRLLAKESWFPILFVFILFIYFYIFLWETSFSLVLMLYSLSGIYQIVEKGNLNMLEFHNIIVLSTSKVIMSICSITTTWLFDMYMYIHVANSDRDILWLSLNYNKELNIVHVNSINSNLNKTENND